MDLSNWERMLESTLEDRKLSRGERRALGGVMGDELLDEHAVRLLRSKAFDLARSELPDARGGAILEWLEEVVKTLEAASGGATGEPGVAEACFSPGDACRERICSLIRGARERLDICVFTITDDRISRAIAEAHQRGVGIRVITDDDKSGDRGSDVEDLARLGVDVVLDHSPAHMHHKFAIFDRRMLLTGSYNWTRSAFTQNEENVVVTDDRRLLKAFQREFDQLWEKLC